MFLASSSLGIDIGNHSIRVALLQKNKRGIHVCNLVEETINGDPLHDVLTKIKHKIKKSAAFPYLLPKHQIMTVSQSQVAIKRLILAANLEEQEQYMQVGMQLSESLGLAYEELLYDYHPLNEQDSIEAYACRRALVEDKLLALANCGFKLTVLELQTQSLMRLYYKKIAQLNNRIALLVDIDFERVQLLLGNENAESFYRELPWSSKELTHLSNSEIENVTQQLAEDILRQSLQINTQFSNINIQELWLCGEGTANINLELLAQHLNWNVSYFDPLCGLSYNNALLNKELKFRGKWSIAIGSALRGINNEY